MLFVYTFSALFIGIIVGALVLSLFYRTRINDLQKHHDEYVTMLNENHDRQSKNIENSFKEQILRLSKDQNDKLSLIENSQKENLTAQMKLIREEFKSTTTDILKQRSLELSETNKEQMSNIITPLQDSIKQMKEAVEKSDKDQTSTIERLNAAIKLSLEQTYNIGERADKLAEALTGQNKTLGNFGELRLRQILEQMNFTEGLQFEEQSTLKDYKGDSIYDEDSNKRLIPDVILHFPDGRDIVIDSKLSLKAFEEFHNAETEEIKQAALTKHINSIQDHANNLSKKNYSKYIKESHTKLDFVIMFFCNESALQLALQNAPNLWQDAYNKGVLITGSHNLYALLRVLEISWKHFRQVENQDNIIKCANEIVNRVQIFYERFNKVEESFRKTQDAINEVKNSTASSGTSIITSARQLLKYGASENLRRKARIPKEDNSIEIENKDE